jgi:hypothetical protein
MRQGWKVLSLCLALALAGPTVAVTHAATGKQTASKSSPSSSKSRRSLRQFTGTVTALDKNSITVEKGGKKPRTLVFSRHEEMRTVGDVEEDAHVTVYYQEDGGRAVAHRVVVKPEKGAKTAR